MDKQIIEHMLKGIYEEMERNEKLEEFKRQGGARWGYEGVYPNRARFKRHRLMLEEKLKEIEKEISSY